MNVRRILRGTDVAASGRTLPLAQVATELPDERETVQPDREEMKRLFADELAALSEEARKQGAEEGAAEAKRKMDAALKAYKSQLDQAQQAKIEQLDSLMQTLKMLVTAVQEERVASAREAEALAVELAYMGTVKMLGESANAYGVLKKLIRGAVRELDPVQSLRIRLAPSDLDKFHNAMTEISAGDLPPNAELVSDDALPPASCIIEHRRGRLDASMLTQLDSFRKALMVAYGLQDQVK